MNITHQMVAFVYKTKIIINLNFLLQIDDKKFIESVNFPVLKSLKQTSKGRALKLEMNQDQLNECNRIEKYFKQFIKDQYDRRAKTDYIIKSIKCGCIFYMRCVESECDCVWEMRLNPKTKECSIISSKICSHLINDNQSEDDNSNDLPDETTLEPGGCFIDKNENISNLILILISVFFKD